MTALTIDDRREIYAAIGNRLARFDGKSGLKLGEWMGGSVPGLNNANRYPAMDVSERWVVAGDSAGRLTCLVHKNGERKELDEAGRCGFKSSVSSVRISPDDRISQRFTDAEDSLMVGRDESVFGREARGDA